MMSATLGGEPSVADVVFHIVTCIYYKRDDTLGMLYALYKIALIKWRTSKLPDSILIR